MDYKQSILSAVDFIESHLTEEIGLAEVAKAVYFSPFHFSRLFTAIVGDSVAEYIRKRRLAKAGDDLLDTDKRIIDIAFDYGWESQEAFSRAFAKAYRATPGSYRKGRLRRFYSQLPVLTEAALVHRMKGEITMEPKIISLPEITVVGMRTEVTIKTAHPKISALWEKFNQRSGEIKHRVRPNVALGVCEYCDSTEFTDDSPYFELVSVMVDQAKDLPTGMVSRTLPACQYAVFTHRGSLTTLRQTYDYIYKTWLPNSGHELAHHDDFEWYDERYIKDDPKSEMDIYVPIK